LAKEPWKYVLKDSPTQPILGFTGVYAPVGMKPLTVGEQANTACLWAEVDPAKPMRWYRIAVVPTGDEIPEVPHRTYLGTAVLTNYRRTHPTPVDNSVCHFYLVEESAEEAVAALPGMPKGIGDNVVAFGRWMAATA